MKKKKKGIGSLNNSKLEDDEEKSYVPCVKWHWVHFQIDKNHLTPHMVSVHSLCVCVC
jgi:hypothetical protein